MEAEFREVNCHCGHTYETDRTVNWCPKCGEKIFDTAKERNAHRMNSVYFYAVIGLTMSAIAFFFFKLIIIPALSM